MFAYLKRNESLEQSTFTSSDWITTLIELHSMKKYVDQPNVSLV